MVVLDVKLDEKDVLLDADAAAASLSLPTTIGNEGRSVPVLLLLLLDARVVWLHLRMSSIAVDQLILISMDQLPITINDRMSIDAM